MNLAFFLACLHLVKFAVTQPCPPHQFSCHSSDQCVDVRLLCDGTSDCRDGSDELSVDCVRCLPAQTKCDNGQCILSLFLCDTIVDCADGSDESAKNCGGTTQPSLLTPSNAEEKTTQPSLVRATTHSLLANADTTDSPCDVGEHQCTDSSCIGMRLLCDGRDDCVDGSDEDNCPVPDFKVLLSEWKMYYEKGKTRSDAEELKKQLC